MTVKRDTTVDIIRGFAMLLVVMGHTISGSVADYSDSFLFQIIWTLQMPLFIIISGYVTRYSKPLTTFAQYVRFLKKRTLTYLLPWIVWTFGVRGVIFGQSDFFDLEHLLYHMDTGYWFLITIWTINVIYGTADWINNKFCPKKFYANTLSHLIFLAGGAIILTGIGLAAGMNFFSIKLTIYYIPFYCLGYLFGKLQEHLITLSFFEKFKEVLIAVCLCGWVALMVRFDFFSNSTGLTMISLRVLASTTGCIAIIGLFSSFCHSSWRGGEILQWCGNHSLEIYLCHYLMLSILSSANLPAISTLQGATVITINFLLTILLTMGLIRLIRNNYILNYLLFAKTR